MPKKRKSKKAPTFYDVEVTVEGTHQLLFHCDPEPVGSFRGYEMGHAPKDKLYRDDQGNICIPGRYLHGAILEAAQHEPDPYNPRKNMHKLIRSSLVCLTELASLGVKKPHHIDQRKAIWHGMKSVWCRPAFEKGWQAKFLFRMAVEIPSSVLNHLIQLAGRLVGLADFRPTYGRFTVIDYRVLDQ